MSPDPRVHRPRHWLRYGIPAAVVVFLVVAYLLLDVIVTYATQKGLNRIEGATATFKSLHVTIFKPGYNIYGLKIVELPAKPKQEPLFYAERVEMRWSWRELVRGHLVRRVKIWNGRAMIPMRPGENGKPAQPPMEIARTLETVPAAGLERLAIVNSQVILVDAHHEGQRLWLHDFDASLENLASRKALMRGLPALVTVRGKLQKTGELSLFLTIDPFDKGITFAGSAEVRHMELSDLHEFTKIAGLTLPKGKLDLFASVTCKRGVLTGGVKPILTGLDVEAADGSLGHRIKAALADVAVKIVSDRVPGRHALATVIPVHGRLDNPQFQLVPAVMAALRNAFVEGLSASLSDVPPPLAGENEGLLKQTVRALSKDEEKPVKAQPRREDD